MSQFQFLDSLVSAQETPVKFSEFVQSHDYCGETELYDFWKNEGDNLDLSITELILDGSLGGGKTTFSNYYLIYYIYNLFLLGSRLRKYLGVSEKSPLYILYFSVSMTQAERSGFNQIRQIIDHCKWFEKNYPRDKSIDSQIRFSNNVHIVYASGEGHQISLNVIAFILDEANFRKGVGKGMAEEYSSVTSLYAQLIDRQITRFSSKEGLKSLAILISSASYQSSFVENRKLQVIDDPSAKIITSVAYKVKPWMFSKETFKVFVGNDIIIPQIVDTDEQFETLKKAVGVDKNKFLEELYFVDVPLSIKKPFITNINLALQNHAGRATQIKGRLVSNMNLVQASYRNDASPWFSNYQATISNKDDSSLMDYVNVDNILYKEHPHYFFLDLSVRQDSAGFTCVRDDSTLYKRDDNLKTLTHTFTLEIVPPEFPASTRIRKIYDFMVDISQIVNVCGFATDQFQSTQLRQDIQSEINLPDVRISIDSSDMVFLYWIGMLVDSRASMIYMPTLHREIREAIHDVKRRRVVKAPNSTDDCFQSLVGAFYLADISENLTLDIPVNIVGERTMKRLARSLGYK